MSSSSQERRRSKDTARRRKIGGPSDEAESSWRDLIVTYVVDTLINARSTCTEKADDCASRSRTHSSRRRSKAKVSRERSTSKVRRARQVGEIEHAPPRPLISKEMTKLYEVEETQASLASEGGAPGIILGPVPATEVQNPPTAVSSAGLEEVPLVPATEVQNPPTAISSAGLEDAQEKVSLVPSEEEQHSPTVSNANPDDAQEKVLLLPSEEERHSPTVSNANPDDAQEEGFPVPSGEEQHSPTVVSFADPDDLPEEFFLAETTTDVKWLWPAWCFQQDPPCIEVCVFEDDDVAFHWLTAVPKPPPAVEEAGENYLAAEYVYEDEAFLQEFHPSHVRKIGEEGTVADILVDGN